MTANQEYMKKNKASRILDDEKNTVLHYASIFADLQLLEVEVVKNGHKIDPENYLGWTPLMMAVRKGQLSVVNFLLENKADATKKNKFGYNLFSIAVSSGNIQIVTIILNHLLCGGISRQHLQKIISPISLSILFCHGKIFLYLLEQNFDINCSTPNSGLTPLMFAAAMDNKKAIKELLLKKANPALRNYLGVTADEITQMKRMKFGENTKAPSNTNLMPPLILITPTSPFINQFPTVFPTPINQHELLRKSSNVQTPSFLFSPNITPITPMPIGIGGQQMFFPPDFTPRHFNSPNLINNSILNMRVNQNGAFFSPFVQ